MKLQQASYETFLPPIPPSPFLHFTLPDGGCAVTSAAGIIFLCIRIFLALYVLYANQIAKIHAKMELSLFGISANRAHPKRGSANINN